MMTVREMESACDSPVLTEYPEHPTKLTELTLRKTYYPYGFPLEVLTNSRIVLEMYDKLWSHFRHKHDTAPMRAYVHVTQGGGAECPPTPSFQYVSPHFVHIADAQHYVVIDLAHSETVISITEASLCHHLYIEYFFLMTPLTTIPVQPVHAGCVAWNGSGVLFCGDSGAGKSTLSYACARAGWDYLSDDAAFVLDDEEEPIVAGDPNLVRFRPSAAELFPEIQGIEQTPRAAGKPSIEISTHDLPKISRRQKVRVDFIVFLKRGSTFPAQVKPYSKDVARMYMRQGVFGSSEIRDRRYASIERLLAADVFELRYSDLGSAIKRLQRLVEDGR